MSTFGNRLGRERFGGCGGRGGRAARKPDAAVDPSRRPSRPVGARAAARRAYSRPPSSSSSSRTPSSSGTARVTRARSAPAGSSATCGGRVSSTLVAVLERAVEAEEARDRRRSAALEQLAGRARRRPAGRRSGSAAGRRAPTPRRGRGRRPASPRRFERSAETASSSRFARVSASRPANGSSSSSTSGSTASARARWTRRRSPPDRAAAPAPGQVLGADRAQRLARARRPLGPRHAPPGERQRHVGEHACGGRDRATAARSRPGRGARSVPSAAGSAPAERVEQRALAGAVGPEQRDDLAGAQLEADVADDLALAAPDDQAARSASSTGSVVGRRASLTPPTGTAAGCPPPCCWSRPSAAHQDQDQRRSGRSRSRPRRRSAAVDLVQRRARERLVVAVDVAADDHDRGRPRTARAERRDHRRDHADPRLAQREHRTAAAARRRARAPGPAARRGSPWTAAAVSATM